MPDALIVFSFRDPESEGESSRSARSSPLVFLTAVLALPLGFEGREASSAARRAAFSAFFATASAALDAACSLFRGGES